MALKLTPPPSGARVMDMEEYFKKYLNPMIENNIEYAPVLKRYVQGAALEGATKRSDVEAQKEMCKHRRPKPLQVKTRGQKINELHKAQFAGKR